MKGLTYGLKDEGAFCKTPGWVCGKFQTIRREKTSTIKLWEFCFVSFPFYINSFSNFASEYILQT